MQVAGLQRRVLELETVEHQKQELLQEREVHQQQSDQRHREITTQLEGALEDATLQISELNQQVGHTESKAQGLEQQLSLSDAKRRDMELKLAGLCSAMRRIVGISRAGFSHTPGPRRRSASPWRNHMQVKGMVIHFHYRMSSYRLCVCDMEMH